MVRASWYDDIQVVSGRVCACMCTRVCISVFVSMYVENRVVVFIPSLYKSEHGFCVFGVEEAWTGLFTVLGFVCHVDWTKTFCLLRRYFVSVCAVSSCMSYSTQLSV